MVTKVWVPLIFALLVIGRETPAASAALIVAPYFTSNMVLQQLMPVPVWGTATAGTTITVSFNGRTVTTLTPTPSSGKWRVDLPSMSASSNSGPGSDLVVSGDGRTITFTNVKVGEVWVLSGQSNINVQLQNCDDGPDAVNTSGEYPNIRLYLIPQTGPLSEKWEVSSPTNTPDWSCVGFFFARALFDDMASRVPIGLIQVGKNGTPIADWTTYAGSGGKLYKGKIKPLQPFAIRGVIWYQGEDDGGRESTALRYKDMLPGLIGNWRSEWGQDQLLYPISFYYVQLALISGRPNWAIIRDAQVSTLDVTSNTAMACIIDVATMPASEIHPKDKEPVGARLALAARALVHGESTLAYSGPIRQLNPTKDGNTVTISFTHTDGGLITEDDNIAPVPAPFLIAGPDGVYYPATATQIEGNTVKVSSQVTNPKYVRYCWGSYPDCNLFNGAGLPASPFQLTVP